jgi:hypothetical protein
MIVGDPCTFAIESGMTLALSRFAFLGLGFFVLHLGGRRYGVHAPDAALLAGAFAEVQSRIARRGQHIAPFASEPRAGRIADAYCDAYRDPIWAASQEKEWFCGLRQEDFRDLIYASQFDWFHDGDNAFDEWSVLHFDVEDRVRLIAFRSIANEFHHDPTTLTDVWLEAKEFYRVLEEWCDLLEAEWKAAPKIEVSEDGTWVDL